MGDRQKFAREAAVQAVGTLVGGLLLIVAAKIGGFLTNVDWAEVGKAIISSGVLVSIGGVIFGAIANRQAVKIVNPRRKS